jgi:DNA-binding transcriptional LysR family regulator
VKQVEEKLGLKIFVKSSHPIKLTDEGKIVVEQARYILNKVDELIAPFKNPAPNALEKFVVNQSQ